MHKRSWYDSGKEIVRDTHGLTVLQISNPFNCNIIYTISGQVECRYYKGRTAYQATNTGSLRPNQLVNLWPQQVFPSANATCQQYQRASGAGPEYGAGILGFAGNSFRAQVIGISR